MESHLDLLSIFDWHSFAFRPELKPVDKETEVVLKFPEVEKLSPPILMLSDVEFAYDKNSARGTIFSKVDLSATMESRICIVRCASTTLFDDI